MRALSHAARRLEMTLAALLLFATLRPFTTCAVAFAVGVLL